MSRFQKFFDKMAAMCPDFKWLGFQILDPIQNPDESELQIPTVSSNLLEHFGVHFTERFQGGIQATIYFKGFLWEKTGQINTSSKIVVIYSSMILSMFFSFFHLPFLTGFLSFWYLGLVSYKPRETALLEWGACSLDLCWPSAADPDGVKISKWAEEW